jgi:DNA-binding Xre family transcriptional regulator
MSNSRRHDWNLVQAKIYERMAELRLSATELARASRLSEKHVRTLLNGGDVPAPRDQTRWALCDALQWTPESIDRILAGDEPLEVVDNSGEVSRLDLLDGRVSEIEALATAGLDQLANQQKELVKFYRLHERLQGAVRDVEGDLRARLEALEKELEGLRRAAGQGDAGTP